MTEPLDSPMYDLEKICLAFPAHKKLFTFFYEGSKQGKAVKGEIKEYPNEEGTVSYDFDFSDGTEDTRENFKICIDTFIQSMQNR